MNWKFIFGAIHRHPPAPSNKAFFLRYCAGEVMADEIHDFIDQWRDNPENHKIELHDFLGLTVEELCMWVDTGHLPPIPEYLKVYRRAVIVEHKG